MHSLKYTLCIPLILFLLVIGLAVISPTDAADFKIVIEPESKKFTPREIRIKRMDTVTWTNTNHIDHFLLSAHHVKNDKADPVYFEIYEPLPPGASYSHTFVKPNTYLYFCAIHNEMSGTIIVEK